MSPAPLPRLVLPLLLAAVSPLEAVSKSWSSTSDGVWSDGSNWSPAGVPLASDDVTLGNLLGTFGTRTTLDMNVTVLNAIDTLTMISGNDLATGDFELIADSASLSGDGTTLLLEPNNGGAADSFDVDFLDVTNDALVRMLGGRLEIDGNTGDGRLDVTGAALIGYGAIDLEASGTAVRFSLADSTLSAGYTTATGIVVSDLARTLRIDAPDPNATVDLDQNGSVVSVLPAGTLDLNVQTNDPFSSSMRLARGSTIDLALPWAFDGTLNVNTEAGAFVTQPAAPATIAGAKMTQTGGTIRLDQDVDHLVFEAPFEATGGTIDFEDGSITFNAPATIGAGVDFRVNDIGGNAVAIEVNAPVVVGDEDWNWDGNRADTRITINDGGSLGVELAETHNFYAGQLELNGGELEVVSFLEWSLLSSAQLRVAGIPESRIGGSRFGMAGGSLVIEPGASLLMEAEALGDDFDPDQVFLGGSMVVDGVLTLSRNTTEWRGTAVSGEGLIRQGDCRVTDDQTIAVARFDWDGGDTNLYPGVTLQLDVDEIDADNVYNALVNLSPGATLEVNVAAASWKLGAGGTIRLASGNLAAGDRLEVLADGTIEAVNQGNEIRCDLDLLAGSLVRLDSSAVLSFTRDSGTMRATLAGGTIVGPGTLSVGPHAELRGFGRIDADIGGFTGGGDVVARDGLLQLNGSIAAIDSIGARGETGVLELTQPFDTSQALAPVNLGGGTVQGAALMLSDFGISGYGTVHNPVINDSVISSVDEPLVLTHPDSDWDGATNSGVLSVGSGTIELQDNARFDFAGTIECDQGPDLFANGFELRPTSDSTIDLVDGGFRSTHSTQFHGTVQVDRGKLATGSLATLEASCKVIIADQLRLDQQSTIVLSGASITGGGALQVVEGNSLELSDGASIGAQIENLGTVGFHDGPSQASGMVLSQGPDATLRFGIGGDSVSEVDSLAILASAQLDGTLELQLLDGHVPTAGESHTILTAPSITGSFDTVVQPPAMPPGLAYDVTVNPTNVRVTAIGTLDPYQEWIDGFATLTDPADRARTANPDGDPLDNLGEFATDGDPASPTADGKRAVRVAAVGGERVLTFSFPVRNGAVPSPSDPAGGPLVLEQATDGLEYRVEAGDLEPGDGAWPLDVSEVTSAEAAMIHATLPTLNPGWIYRSFRSPGPVDGDASDFIRLVVTEIEPP